MDTLQCIKTRRSIRRFTEQPVSREVLAELMEAVRWAPSWSNTQCWEVIVVQNPETCERLAGLTSDKNPATQGILQAPVVLVFCARRGISGMKNQQPRTNKGDWFMFDMGIACQQFCLAAHSLGLGTVHVGSFNHREVDLLLGLPEDIESVEIIPLGYPAIHPPTSSRKPVDAFVHFEFYGGYDDI